MQQDFQPSLALVLQSEGGYSLNKNDPGGATNKGVTQRVYDAYRRAHGLRPQAVMFIGSGEVTAIYQAQYWDAVRGNDVWAGLGYTLFDEAVNSGPVKSIKDLQTALRVKADGQFGMVTLDALRAVNDRADLINRICDLRLSWLHRLTTWRFFGKGWANRVAVVRTNALQMAKA